MEQAGVLFQLWFNRGSVTEGQAWLQEILALPAATGSPSTSAVLMAQEHYLGETTAWPCPCPRSPRSLP
jgi:hypothetical protein